MPARTRQPASEAEPEGAPEPAPEINLEAGDGADAGSAGPGTAALSSQIAGLAKLLTRLVGTVEAQDEKLA